MLDVDAARESAGEIADEILEGGWAAERVLGEDREQLLGLCSETGRGKLARVLLRCPGQNSTRKPSS